MPVQCAVSRGFVSISSRRIGRAQKDGAARREAVSRAIGLCQGGMRKGASGGMPQRVPFPGPWRVFLTLQTQAIGCDLSAYIV
jgi:hypothetical protein